MVEPGIFASGSDVPGASGTVPFGTGDDAAIFSYGLGICDMCPVSFLPFAMVPPTGVLPQTALWLSRVASTTVSLGCHRGPRTMRTNWVDPLWRSCPMTVCAPYSSSAASQLKRPRAKGHHLDYASACCSSASSSSSSCTSGSLAVSTSSSDPGSPPRDPQHLLQNVV